MQNLMDACKEKRLRSSGSHSLYTSPTIRIVEKTKLYVTAGAIRCYISEGSITSIPVLSLAFNVKGCLFGDTGVWLSITCGDFWLEIHAPTLTDRQVQTRAQAPKC